MATMQVEVVSAESHVLSAEVSELYARSVEGEIGILPGHQPALVALDVGPVRLVLPDGTVERIAVHAGLLFVGEDGRAIVLADIAERASAVDVRRAEARVRELEATLGAEDDAVLRMSLRKHRLRLEVAREQA